MKNEQYSALFVVVEEENVTAGTWKRKRPADRHDATSLVSSDSFVHEIKTSSSMELTSQHGQELNVERLNGSG